jgi:hypothetical protein
MEERRNETEKKKNGVEILGFTGTGPRLSIW